METVVREAEAARDGASVSRVYRIRRTNDGHSPEGTSMGVLHPPERARDLAVIRGQPGDR